MEPQTFSVASFCELHGFSKPTFYLLLREGRGPKTIRVGRRRLITVEAAAEWRKRMSDEPHFSNIVGA